MINLAILTFCLLQQILCYIEVPLIHTSKNNSVSYSIPVTIKQYQYNIGINLDNSTSQYIKPFKDFKPKKSKDHHKDGKNADYTYGVLKATSVQGYSFQGWRRYVMQALFFTDKRHSHELPLQLDFLQIRQQHTSPLSNGSLNLSPTPSQNNFYLQIKKNSNYIHDDIFAIYLGVHQSQHRIQFGGYEDDYARFTNGVKFATVRAKEDKGRWVMPVMRMMFSKEKDNKWEEYTLDGGEVGVVLRLDSNMMTIVQQIVPKVQVALQSHSITCSMSTLLTCQNITSIQLSLHMFALQLTPDFFVNISLYRLLNHCDDKLHRCTFNIKVDKQFSIGDSFFKEYYSVFDMTQNIIMVAQCNKYPESWFSTVYLFRFVVWFGAMICVAGMVAASPQFYENYVYWRRRRSGLQGIELVNQGSKEHLDD